MLFFFEFCCRFLILTIELLGMRSGEELQGVLVQLWEPKLGASLTHMQRQAEPRSTEATGECARLSFTKNGFEDASDIEGKNKKSVRRVLHLVGFLERLGMTFGSHLRTLGGPGGDLGAIWGDLGGPWGDLGGLWGDLGGLGGLWGDLGGLWGDFGSLWAA